MNRGVIQYIIISIASIAMLMSGCANPAPEISQQESVTLKTTAQGNSRTKVTVKWNYHETPILLGIYIPYLPGEYPGAPREIELDLIPGNKTERLDGIMIIRPIRDQHGSDAFTIDNEFLKIYFEDNEPELRTMWLDDIDVVVREDSRIKGTGTTSVDRINQNNAPSGLTLLKPSAARYFGGIRHVRNQEVGEHGYIQYLIYNAITKEHRVVVQLD